MKIKENGFVYVSSLDGHRREYLNLLSKQINLFPCSGPILRIKKFKQLIFTKKLLFASLDDNVIGFFFIAAIRAFIGRRTSGLLIRPQSCFLKSVKSIIKFNMLRVLLVSKKIKIFTIVTHHVDVRYSLISSGSIYDPQMWDKWELLAPRNTPLAEEISKKSAGRDILMFIGSLNIAKGIDYFIELMLDGNLDNIFFVAVGSLKDKSILMGLPEIESKGLILDYRPTDLEISSFYKIAKFIWCCYSPGYDQASGIFGRALQYRRIPFVRKGSTLAKIAVLEHVSVIEIDTDNKHNNIDLKKYDYNIYNHTIEDSRVLAWRLNSIDILNNSL